MAHLRSGAPSPFASPRGCPCSGPSRCPGSRMHPVARRCCERHRGSSRPGVRQATPPSGQDEPSYACLPIQHARTLRTPNPGTLDALRPAYGWNIRHTLPIPGRSRLPINAQTKRGRLTVVCTTAWTQHRRSPPGPTPTIRDKALSARRIFGTASSIGMSTCMVVLRPALGVRRGP